MPLVEMKDGTQTYTEWLLQQLKTFNVQKQWLRERLNCTDRFIELIEQKVDYIKVVRGLIAPELIPETCSEDERETLMAVKACPSPIYLNGQDLLKYLVETPQYSRQTKLLSVELLLREDALHRYHDDVNLLYNETNPHHRRVIRDRIERTLHSACPETLVVRKYKDRKKYPPRKVAPFDWFTGMHFRPANKLKDSYRNQEAMYRDMFRRGAVRITFGKNKTYFYDYVQSDDDRGDEFSFALVPADYGSGSTDHAQEDRKDIPTILGQLHDDGCKER